MIENIVRGMRSRVARCRRLAERVNDPEVSRELLQMAEEGEAAIKELLPPPPDGLDKPILI
jgi:hypothetical protein